MQKCKKSDSLMSPVLKTKGGMRFFLSPQATFIRFRSVCRWNNICPYWAASGNLKMFSMGKIRFWFIYHWFASSVSVEILRKLFVKVLGRGATLLDRVEGAKIYSESPARKANWVERFVAESCTSWRAAHRRLERPRSCIFAQTWSKASKSQQ